MHVGRGEGQAIAGETFGAGRVMRGRANFCDLLADHEGGERARALRARIAGGDDPDDPLLLQLAKRVMVGGAEAADPNDGGTNRCLYHGKKGVVEAALFFQEPL